MSQSEILALGIAGDVHLHAVQSALERMGGKVQLWFTSDFPSRATETVEYSQSNKRSALRDVETTKTDLHPTAVWNRRVTYDRRHYALASEDCEFAEIECHKFREGFLRSLAPDSFWVNPRSAAVNSENKLWQHEVARTLGIRTPCSLYSNDPEEIRRFIRAHGDQVVYKPFLGAGWSEEGTKWGCYTSLCTEADLPEDRIL